MNPDLSADPQRLVQVESGEQGQRVDRFLLTHYPELSRSVVLQAITEGMARVNGRRVRKGQRLRQGDQVTLEGPLSVAAQPDDRVELQVPLVDSELLVVEKPAGLPCHPLRPGETRTLASGLLARYPELSAVGDDPREPGLVHRLDTDTSGLVLVARNGTVWAELRDALRRGAIEKTYVARCLPHADAEPLALGAHHAFLSAGRTRKVWVGLESRADCRPITTEVRSVRPLPDGSCVVQVRVHCASRHQVRAHLAVLGYPLVGDSQYGGPERLGGHLLHASTIAFVHPHSGRKLKVESTPPPPFYGD